jgi:hypothetical protein
MKKRDVVIIVVMSIFFILSGAVLFSFYRHPVSYVGIDVNPSFHLALNRLDRVVDVVALNRDAEIVISDLNLLNLPVEKALEKIVDNSIEIGYIDEFSEENIIVVSAILNEEEEAEKAEKKLYKTVEDYFSEKKVPAVILMEHNNEERRALAESYGVSYGELLIAQKTVVLNPDLSLDEIIKDSIKVNAKRMNDANKEINKARLNEKKEFEKAKEKLREQNRLRRENAIKEMLKEVAEEKQKITEENMEQFREQIINNKKEELIKDVGNLRKYIEREWSGSSQEAEGKEIEETIDEGVREKIGNIKGRWNNRAR